MDFSEIIHAWKNDDVELAILSIYYIGQCIVANIF